MESEKLSVKQIGGDVNMNMIYFVEKNVHGAWVIYGTDGVKQYYYYTKTEAIRKYKADSKVLTCKGNKRHE